MEIIDEKGNVLPDGEWGELVITTIGMEAQPLIRYRTGDCTRIIPGRCICGSEVKRLDFVKRISQPGTIREMDDVLFQIPELVDYSVRITEDKKEITALLTSDKGMESLRNVLTDGDTISLNCRKAEWKDYSLIFCKTRDTLLYRIIWTTTTGIICNAPSSYLPRKKYRAIHQDSPVFFNSNYSQSLENSSATN